MTLGALFDGACFRHRDCRLRRSNSRTATAAAIDTCTKLGNFVRLYNSLKASELDKPPRLPGWMRESGLATAAPSHLLTTQPTHLLKNVNPTLKCIGLACGLKQKENGVSWSTFVVANERPVRLAATESYPTVWFETRTVPHGRQQMLSLTSPRRPRHHLRIPTGVNFSVRGTQGKNYLNDVSDCMYANTSRVI